MKKQLLSFLTFYASSEGRLRTAILLMVLYLIIANSTLFEESYNQKLMDLYTYPWWRFLMVFMVIASAMWAPELAIFIAMMIFFYLNDMSTLIQPIARG